MRTEFNPKYSHSYSYVANTFRDFKMPNNPNAYLQQNNNDKFEKQNILSANHKSKIIKTSMIISGTVIAGILLAKTKSVQNIFNKYPLDRDYRKSILKDMGLSIKEHKKLNSIIGIQELKDIVRKYESTPEVYSPGIKTYERNGEVKFNGKENLKNFIFGANLHIHTKYSDGKLTIDDFLDQAVTYADKRVENGKSPFVIAITDHDSVQGCKDIVNKILQNPKKYKNLKVVLGIENSSIYYNPHITKDKINIHVLSYGINPFGKDIDKFLTSRLNANKNNIINVIEEINKDFSSTLNKYNFKYNFDEMNIMAPCVGSSIKTSNYYLKDYLQFKLIYENLITKNQKLMTFLEQNRIKLKPSAFADALKEIPQKPDYSKGQKYWEYYCDALKKYIEKVSMLQNSQINTKKLNEKFISLDTNTKNIINKFESICLDPNSKFYLKNIEYPQFEKCIKDLYTLENGVMGLAHPSVYFPINAVPQKNKKKLYEELYKTFKAEGKEKAVFAEDNYQVYYDSADKILLKELSDMSSSYGLLKTGGLDTHAISIFDSK